MVLRAGAKYMGVDIAEEMLSIPRERRPDLQFQKVSSPELPFEAGHFDLVFSVTVLHHNPYERQAAMIAELVRVTRPGGLILLMESIRSGPRIVPAPSTPTRFNGFPRYLEDWVAEVEKGGCVDLVRNRLSRWSALRDGVNAVGRRLARFLPGFRTEWQFLPIGLDRALVRLGKWIDPFLMPLLPKRYARNAGLCFRKR